MMLVRSAELWGGLFWLALSAFAVWAGRDLGLGSLHDPGSGFVLFWLGAIMTALSASVVLGALRAPGESLSSLWTGKRWMRVLALTGMLVAYGFLFEIVGFVAGSVLLLLAVMVFIDRVDLRAAVPVAVLVPSAIYYAITHWLKIQLPVGVLAPWLS
ncbi:MAG: tripartite tricarboxylate transporter TctB family protein [Hyphomicrobiaceae bacterium]|nr:tripartite tricarboxylate transporter TctB family protein [Hyphomicrobiaceae bacterium]